MQNHPSHSFNKLIASFFILVLMLAAVPVQPAFAATITVTNTADSLASGNGCSLREAIINANNDAATHPDCPAGMGADIIVLSSGATYTLSLAGGDSTGNDLDIDDPDGLTIQTTGADPATISASGVTDRVLDVASGDLTLDNLVIRNGSASNGGGIRFESAGSLTLVNSTISNNTGTASGNCGGGIYSTTASSFSISGSAIADNSCTTAGADGGGVYYANGSGTLEVTNSTFYNNSTGPTSGGNGGGMLLDVASGTIAFSTFSHNTATGNGGALQFAGTALTIRNSILANSSGANDCQRSTGTIFLDNSLVETSATSGTCGLPTFSADPGLGAFQANGGPTSSMAITTASTAFDNASACTGSNGVDQRGFARPENAACDLGAFELDHAATTTVVNPATGNYGNTVNLSATVTETVTGAPVEGMAVDFAVNGVSVGSANTNASGTATLMNVTLTDNAALYPGGAGSGIEAGFSGDSFFDASSNSANLTVNPRPITVTAVTDTKVYDGTTDSLETPTITGGIVPGDTANFTQSFDTKNTGTNKTLSPSGSVSDGNGGANYAVTFQNNTTGEIMAKGISVTANSGQGKVYSSSDPALTYTSDPLIGGDSFSGALARAAGEDVGFYAINQGTLSAGPNYAISFVPANFQITPKGLTISGVLANDKVYDGTILATLDTSGAGLVGVVGLDDVNLDDSGAGGLFADKNAGNGKPVTVSGFALSGADAGNYSLAQPSGLSADIVPKGLTVTADDKTITFGFPEPAYTFQYDGFIPGEGPGDLTTEPACSVVENPHTDVGTYTIACSGGAADNYAFTYVSGTLTIIPANNPPTDIGLSSTSVDENQPAGTLVGILTTTDPDLNTFTYTLVDNPGTCDGPDNASFGILGDQLQTAEVFDYETKASYLICVQTDDNNGGTFQKQFTITVNDLIEKITKQFKSAGSLDGWVLESGETTNKGGTLNNTGNLFNLGDNLRDQQYRAILSFNTAMLPDNAVITKVTLRIKKQGLVGTNPFTTHGKILLDIRTGVFSNLAGLQLTDFQAAASQAWAGSIGNSATAWFSGNLNAAGRSKINPKGLTQIRLRFAKDDNNDNNNDFLKFFSGNAPLASRPTLIIEYYIP